MILPDLHPDWRVWAWSGAAAAALLVQGPLLFGTVLMLELLTSPEEGEGDEQPSGAPTPAGLD